MLDNKCVCQVKTAPPLVSVDAVSQLAAACLYLKLYGEGGAGAAE